jgi:lysyl-tRNA synthetase class 1
MNELDYLEDVYFGKKPARDEKELVKLHGLYEYCWVMKPPSKPSVHAPYNLLTFLAKMAPKECPTEFITEKLQSYGYLQKNQAIDADLAKRIEYAFNWIRDFEEIKETTVSLTTEEKHAIVDLVKVLETEDAPDKIQNAIFNAAKSHGLQHGAFFRVLYMILMGTQQGPRLGPYVLAMGKQNVIAALQRALSKSNN